MIMRRLLVVYIIFSFTLTIHGDESLCDSSDSWAWTPWFNSHAPNSNGEYELHLGIRSQYPALVCAHPRAISVMNQDGVNMDQTQDKMIIRAYDIFCMNNYHSEYQKKMCDDYSVRYCCPKVENSTETENLREIFIASNEAKSTKLKCGQSPRSSATIFLSIIDDMSSKIINGVEARPKSWPWLVSIGVRYRGLNGVWQNRTHICGGTLIDLSHVLTAGHCLEQKIDDRFVPLTPTNPTLESFFFLRLGVHDIRLTRSEDIYRARKIFVHDKFISSTFENDIAMIRLDRPVSVSDSISPICLPSTNVSPGRSVTVAGWGTVSEASRVHSNVLRQANVNVLSSINCRVYMSIHYDGSKQVCAAALDWSKDTCAGDSGGPLMYQENGAWSIGGITSFGYGCSKRGFPGVYTRTVPYVSWIKQRMLSN
ncbi:unnamed protein product [Adineta ricciae]|uniref:Peptidase S1 domain-containing protein n=1 Tax=Adineta ricciae TaxID=249248 RepID=A0A815BVL2_ADIRI|nr:unnamed protein product [Adineta ricciae]CAF1276980.1 unnamed protein product [Adineta ricciae]